MAEKETNERLAERILAYVETQQLRPYEHGKMFVEAAMRLRATPDSPATESPRRKPRPSNTFQVFLDADDRLPCWPYCTKCRRPFSFDHDGPFAHCGCGTGEWGEPRPATYVADPIRLIEDFRAGIDQIREAERLIEGYRANTEQLVRLAREEGFSTAGGSMISNDQVAEAAVLAGDYEAYHNKYNPSVSGAVPPYAEIIWIGGLGYRRQGNDLICCTGSRGPIGPKGPVADRGPDYDAEQKAMGGEQGPIMPGPPDVEGPTWTPETPEEAEQAAPPPADDAPGTKYTRDTLRELIKNYMMIDSACTRGIAAQKDLEERLEKQGRKIEHALRDMDGLPYRGEGAHYQVVFPRGDTLMLLNVRRLGYSDAANGRGGNPVSIQPLDLSL